MFRFFKKKTVEPLHRNGSTEKLSHNPEKLHSNNNPKEKKEAPIEKKEEETKETFKPENNSPLVEGKHFYIENGCYVFTAYYLKNRGYCCGNGCRHCPYA